MRCQRCEKEQHLSLALVIERVVLVHQFTKLTVNLPNHVLQLVHTNPLGQQE